MNAEERLRRGRKRLASEIQRICPQPPEEEEQQQSFSASTPLSAQPKDLIHEPLRTLDALLSRRVDEELGESESGSFKAELRREIRAVEERLSRRLDEVGRKLDAHIGLCSILGAGKGSGGSVLPTATLPLSLPLPSQQSPGGAGDRGAEAEIDVDESSHGFLGLGRVAAAAAALEPAKVSPFSGNDSATSDGSSSGAGPSSLLAPSPLASLPTSSLSALPSLPSLQSLPPPRPPQRRSQAKEAPRPLVMTDYAKYVGDGSDPIVYPAAEEEDRWRKLEEAGTTPQLPTSYCWSLLRGRLGVEGLVHPSLTKSEACPPNSSLKDLLRRQSNVIAQALMLTLRRYSKADASEADTRQLARNVMRQVIKNVNTLRTSYKHVAMRQQYEADLDGVANVASAFQKLRQQYFAQQGFSLA